MHTVDRIGPEGRGRGRGRGRGGRTTSSVETRAAALARKVQTHEVSGETAFEIFGD
jgi:hypothetical protein